MSHYEVIGVDRTATPAEIHRAYLARARRVHPDFHTDATPAERAEAEREMRRLNEAWAVLGDERQRLDYDGELAARERQAMRNRPPGAPSPDFVPYVDDDTDYAALLDDAGPGNGTTVPRAVQVAPVLLLGVAVFALSAGLVTSFPPFFAVGVTSLLLSALAFLLTPAFAIIRSLASDQE